LARYNAENGARIPMSDANTDMALTRTRMAAERTLMAWIRTAFSMISFGFTIGMFFQYLNEQQHSGGRAGEGRTLAVLLILLGLLSIIAGVWEYRRVIAGLESSTGQRHSAGSILAIAALVGILGMVAFAGIFVHIDLF
jgi:uncharacterized membrane protein YidH (DUF202 family)